MRLGKFLLVHILCAILCIVAVMVYPGAHVGILTFAFGTLLFWSIVVYVFFQLIYSVFKNQFLREGILFKIIFYLPSVLIISFSVLYMLYVKMEWDW